MLTDLSKTSSFRHFPTVLRPYLPNAPQTFKSYPFPGVSSGPSLSSHPFPELLHFFLPFPSNAALSSAVSYQETLGSVYLVSRFYHGLPVSDFGAIDCSHDSFPIKSAALTVSSSALLCHCCCKGVHPSLLI